MAKQRFNDLRTAIRFAIVDNAIATGSSNRITVIRALMDVLSSEAALIGRLGDYGSREDIEANYEDFIDFAEDYDEISLMHNDLNAIKADIGTAAKQWDIVAEKLLDEINFALPDDADINCVEDFYAAYEVAEGYKVPEVIDLQKGLARRIKALSLVK